LIFALADRLKCQVSDIEAMPETEFREWVIYLTKIKPEIDRQGSRR